MRFEIQSSFTRHLKKLRSNEKAQVQNSLEDVMRFFETGEKRHGLGMKQLRRELWEARAGIQTRIIFRLEKNLIQFVLVGNHDDVKRFLKHQR